MIKKIISIVCILAITSVISIILINAGDVNQSSNFVEVDRYIDPSTNFFTQVSDKTLVEEVSNPEDVLSLDYEYVCENTYLKLYLDRSTAGICVYDKEAHYIWYSAYKNYDSSLYNDTVKAMISSGIQIEVYDSTTLNDVARYSSNEKECELTYTINSNSIVIHSNFKTSGISFDTVVSLNDKDLNVNVLNDTIKEVPYKTAAMKYAKEYKLKSITLFPYFGSDNYEINGYSFIPDGSGALIKFTNESYDTAYIKRVYGDDTGVLNYTESEYLKNNNNITLPIYGINHGYKQASVLVTATSGYGSLELHSYPYNYSNVNLNRTFFQYIARNKYNIEMASSDSGKVSVIDSTIMQEPLSLKYSFLSGESAGYVGMAQKYKEEFEFSNTSKSSLKLDVISQDYKPGLFGKNYIVMTSYNELQNILMNLKNEGIKDITINYIGYNKNGFYDNTLSNVSIDYKLGSKQDFINLLSYCKNNNIDIYFYSNPIVATNNYLSRQTIKKLDLQVFDYTFKSSIEQTGRFINPLKICEYFLENQKVYTRYEMNNFTFNMLGNTTFSYRYKTDNYTKEQMINQVISEVKDITSNNYNLSLERPNNYLFNYINNYFDSNYESSKYAFITDSVPFISILLSGNVSMYSENINYVSDYNLFMLRLIEYGINPSYIITNNTTSDLRYCNYEYLYTTEFNKWKSNIINISSNVLNVLSKTNGSKIIDHEYVEKGIAKVTYDNGIIIYVNYTDTDFNISDKVVRHSSYLVIGGSSNE